MLNYLNTVFYDLIFFNSPLILERISNYSIYNNLFILWNNSDYLLFIYLLLIAYRFKNYFFTYTAIFCFLYVSYLSSESLIFLSYQLENIGMNELLINSLNKIHPFILHLSIFLVFVMISEVRYKPTWFLSLKINSLSLLLLAINLGAWWAFQEGNWGGWWEWDPSEFLSLALLIVVILYNHIKLGHSTNFTFRLVSFISLGLFLAYFVFLNLYFSNTSHNFGLPLNYFFNSFLIKILLLVFFWSISFSLNKFLVLSLFNFKKYFTQTLITLTFVILIIFSVKKILLIEIFLLSKIILMKDLLILLFINSFFIVLFKKLNYLNIWSFIVLESLFYTKIKSKITLIHFSILIFLYFSIKYYYYFNFKFSNEFLLNFLNTNISYNIKNFYIVENYLNFSSTITTNFYSSNSVTSIVKEASISSCFTTFFLIGTSFFIKIKFLYLESIFLIFIVFGF